MEGHPPRGPRELARVVLRVDTDAAVAAAIVRRAAEAIGATRLRAAELATIAAELASNAIRHGGGGCVLLDFDPPAVLVRAQNLRAAGDGVFADRLRLALSDRLRAERGLGAVVRLADGVTLGEGPSGREEIVARKRLVGVR